LAFVGIVDTVFQQPISAFLATSGVMAIVLGLALQNTLADVFSGLAINIERPYMAGDWISVTDRVSGQVIEVNWRATRIRTPLFKRPPAIPGITSAR
jgi:small-conductance mechanosensitive channel